MSVSALGPSCLSVTHSLWRGDLAIRSRAQGCDHSCAAAVCAANAIAVSAKMIDAWRFMMHLVVGLAEKILLAFAYCDKDFVLAYQLGEEAELGVLGNF